MRRAALALATLAAFTAPGAGPGAVKGAARAPLTVYAAASLTDVFPKIDAAARYSFGGSNTLAAQIRQGAPADVFAAANTTLPQQLNAAGLCAKPVVFTRNALVLIVPSSNPAAIHTVYDLKKPGVKLVVAAPAVPVGGYTLQILKNMALTSVLQNVVSQENDVREVLSKVALGEADAGFVYSTDARTVPGKLTAIKVPAWAQPKVEYGMCVVSSSPNKAAAQAFVAKVIGRAGQAKLIAAGFLPRVKRK
jgi:molybdate transport system substrate-binding protein